MSYLRYFGAIIGCLFLFGCFQTETVIRLKPDGSGVVEETLLLSKELLESFQELANTFTEDEGKGKNSGAKEKQDPIQGMIRDAKKKESQFGPGVKFISAIPLNTETMGGYKAIYAFQDINKLKINQNPGKKVGNKDAGKEDSTQEENLLFQFKKGSTSILTVILPKAKEKKNNASPKKDPPVTEAADPKALEQMKKILKDMGVRIALEVEGTILKTNATYRKKSEITFMELNFGKLIENKDTLEKIAVATPKTMEEAKELVKGIEGLKIEITNPVVVEFK